MYSCSDRMCGALDCPKCYPGSAHEYGQDDYDEDEDDRDYDDDRDCEMEGY